jgi:hypothetical protein
MTVVGTTDKIILAIHGAPMLLALLVINLAVLAMVTFLTVEAAKIRKAERAELVTALQTCLSQPKAQ